MKVLKLSSGNKNISFIESGKMTTPKNEYSSYAKKIVKLTKDDGFTYEAIFLASGATTRGSDEKMTSSGYFKITSSNNTAYYYTNLKQEISFTASGYETKVWAPTSWTSSSSWSPTSTSTKYLKVYSPYKRFDDGNYYIYYGTDTTKTSMSSINGISGTEYATTVTTLSGKFYLNRVLDSSITLTISVNGTLTKNYSGGIAKPENLYATETVTISSTSNLSSGLYYVTTDLEYDGTHATNGYLSGTSTSFTGIRHPCKISTEWTGTNFKMKWGDGNPTRIVIKRFDGYIIYDNSSTIKTTYPIEYKAGEKTA